MILNEKKYYMLLQMPLKKYHSLHSTSYPKKLHAQKYQKKSDIQRLLLNEEPSENYIFINVTHSLKKRMNNVSKRNEMLRQTIIIFFSCKSLKHLGT